MGVESDRRPLSVMFRNRRVWLRSRRRPDEEIKKLEEEKSKIRNALLLTLPEQQKVLTAGELVFGDTRVYKRPQKLQRFFTTKSDMIIGNLILESESHGMNGRTKNAVMQYGNYYDDMLAVFDQQGLKIRFDIKLDQLLRIGCVFKPIDQATSDLHGRFDIKKARKYQEGLQIDVRDAHGLFRPATNPQTYILAQNLMNFYIDNYKPKFLKREYR